MAQLNLRNPNGYDGSPGTATRQGIVRFATVAEAAAGTMNNVAISPATAQSAVLLDFASPPVLGFGSTTPRPVHATTLDSTGLTSLATTAGSDLNLGNATGDIGFFGATAVAKPAATDDLRVALINLGLYTTGGATPLDLNGGTLTAATVNTTTFTATTINGTTITTNVAAAQLSLNATTIAATGSDANVSLNLTAKGTGSLVFSQSKAGVDQNMQITNSDNTAAAGHAGLQIAVGGSTSTGDPYLSFQVSGVGASTMTMGLDNSNSDLFVISNSTTLGTSNALTLTQAGALTATTTLTATAGAITATNGNFVGSTAGSGLLLNANTATGAASGPVILNSRAGQVIFTSVSIAAAADLTLTITNSEVTASTTQIIYSMSGATTGSALSIKSVTNSSGSSAIVVTNGTGATTTIEDITMNFIVVN